MAVLFQFHYGSVKSLNAFAAAVINDLFQFHYGSVKSFTNSALNRNANIFQFHYGSVKSEALVVVPWDRGYFNSTMVRLKEQLQGSFLVAAQISIPLWFG